MVVHSAPLPYSDSLLPEGTPGDYYCSEPPVKGHKTLKIPTDGPPEGEDPGSGPKTSVTRRTRVPSSETRSERDDGPVRETTTTRVPDPLPPNLSVGGWEGDSGRPKRKRNGRY